VRDPRNSRRRVALGVAACLLGGAVALLQVRGCPRGHPPNVLVITIDTLRADHLGCYGFAAARTPHIDRLAAEGVRCADAISAAPITMPSHSSIFTGLFPPAHGVRDNGAFALGDENVTLAERLKARGYATQAFVSAIVLSRRYNLNQGFDGYHDDLWAEDQPKLFMIRDRPAARTAELAASWLGRWAKSSPRQPFFLWVHFFDPHQPYAASLEDRKGAASPYDAEIVSADRGVGRLLDALREADVLDDTLVVLTADHGESLGEHQEKTHALFVYDATVHVPLILRYPAKLPGGRVYPGPVRSVDIVPTALALLGLPGGQETQGQSLLREFRGEASPLDLPQYSESLLAELGFGMAPLHAVRLGGYKLIRAPRPELYDLRADPHELRNIYGAEKGRAARMELELDHLLEGSTRLARQVKENPMTRESEEALRALGYLSSGVDRKSMGGMDPKDGIRFYNRLEEARHFAQRERWAEAERILRGILDEIPAHLSARNTLAFCLLRENRLDEAQKECEASLAQDPTQFRILGMLGGIALARGDLDEADRRFRTALDQAHTFVEAMVNLGFIRLLRGDEAGAREWYDKAVAADPKLPLVHRRLGDLYYERHDYASALVYYRHGLEILPRDFRALVQAGNSAKHVGDDAAAREYYRKAREVQPKSWVPAYDLACLEAVRGRVAEALAALDESIAKGMSQPRLLERDSELFSLRKDPRFAKRLDAVRLASRSDSDEEES
jgi:arylsulfatase A-like enzyme/tetratricopeptide (TPR) repeat protein